MSKAAHTNQNYIHACNGQRAKLESSRQPLTNIYVEGELKEVVRFYLLQAPIKKSDAKATSLKALRDFGWKDSKGLNELERKLLASSDIASFVMMRSVSISNTLKSMDLDDEVCIEHPRAVLQWPTSVSLNEDGTIRKSSTETRMVCLFRHIRNAIAHSGTYALGNEMLLLEDNDNRGAVTARILIRKQTLLDWIEIVERKERS